MRSRKAELRDPGLEPRGEAHEEAVMTREEPEEGLLRANRRVVG